MDQSLENKINQLPESTLAMIGVFVIIICIISIIAWWKIFTKAGLKGWKSIIPIYSQYCLFRISGMSGWWCFLGIVPALCMSLAGFNLSATEFNPTPEQMRNPMLWIGLVVAVISTIVSIVQAVKLAEGFKKGTGFKVLSVFFPQLMALILGLGSSKYDKKYLHD